MNLPKIDFFDDFPNESLSDLRSIESEPCDFSSREKLKGVTFDCRYAKVLEDGLNVTRTDYGFWVQVSVFDLSEYIERGSYFDQYALERSATRGYKRMLPIELVEFLSFAEGQYRPALTFEYSLSNDFEVSRFNVRETLFKPVKSMSFSEGELFLNPCLDKRADYIKNMVVCGEGLYKKRHSRLGEDLRDKCYKRECGQLGDAVEEIILATGSALAEFMMEKEISGLYRNNRYDRRLPMDMIERIEGLEGVFINDQVIDTGLGLYSYYSCINDGNYTLGFRNGYVRFSSPVRRYGDLVQHRLLKSFLKEEESKMEFEDLENLAAYLNARKLQQNDYFEIGRVDDYESFKLDFLSYLTQERIEVLDDSVFRLLSRDLKAMGLKDFVDECKSWRLDR